MQIFSNRTNSKQESIRIPCPLARSLWGGIQQLRGQNFAILDPPLAWTVFIHWAWTKTDIFDPFPPSSCPRSYWMAPTSAQSITFTAGRESKNLHKTTWRSKYTLFKNIFDSILITKVNLLGFFHLKHKNLLDVFFSVFSGITD